MCNIFERENFSSLPSLDTKCLDLKYVLLLYLTLSSDDVERRRLLLAEISFTNLG